MNRPWTGRDWSSSAPASPDSPRGATRPGSGYRTTILEMGQVPGGLCTSWRRKGYLFDGSVAGLAGTSPEAPIYRLWRDIGVVDYCPLYDPVDFGTVVAPDGRAVTVYTDIDRLEAHLLESFPARRGDRSPSSCGRCAPACASTSRSGPRAVWRASSPTPGRAQRRCAACRRCSGTGASRCVEFNARLQDPFCRQVFDNLVHFGGPDVPRAHRPPPASPTPTAG